MRNRRLRTHASNDESPWLADLYFSGTAREKQSSAPRRHSSHSPGQGSVLLRDCDGSLPVGFHSSFTAIEDALRQNGFSSPSVIRHKTARICLATNGDVKLCIIGGYGSYNDRAQILARIKETLPWVRVIAIQHYSEDPLLGADLNIAGEFDFERDACSTILPMVSARSL